MKGLQSTIGVADLETDVRRLGVVLDLLRVGTPVSPTTALEDESISLAKTNSHSKQTAYQLVHAHIEGTKDERDLLRVLQHVALEERGDQHKVVEGHVRVWNERRGSGHCEQKARKSLKDSP